jgi:hypothetical protein
MEGETIMYTLYLQNGEKMMFYIEECAKTFQKAFGGTLIGDSPKKYTFRSSTWDKNEILMLERESLLMMDE